MTCPAGARSSSVGSSAACQVRAVASNTEPSRLDAVSSGPMSRKLSGLAAITSRRNVPRMRVASLNEVPGFGTSTA